MKAQMNELGFYTLAGAPESPRELIDEVRTAESLGLGSVFLSERFNVKEAATLSGAVGAVSTNLGIATAATNQNTRHPMVTAAFAMTMHRLTGGRFSLGLGRGIKRIFDAFGLPAIKTAEMEDFADLMRRIWKGDVVFGHDGPAGKFPLLAMGPDYNDDIPMTLTAFADPSLKLGGRAFDAVVLHTFFSDETTARCVRTVKEAAEAAGRDPATVRVWSCFATVGDHLPEDLRLKKTIGRLATYLQGYGDLMVKTNRWDPDVLKRFREDEFVSSFAGALDASATTEDLERVAALLPDEWLEASATGSPEQCVAKITEQFDLGCDGVILHGCSPSELAPIVEAYRSSRPQDGRFDHLLANPAASA
jgi:probable F420-dependent oxidoreductase